MAGKSVQTNSFPRRLVAFYLPLARPLLIPPNHGYTFSFPEQSPWKPTETWASRWQPLQQEFAAQNCVLLRLSQETGILMPDLEQLARAMQMALLDQGKDPPSRDALRDLSNQQAERGYQSVVIALTALIPPEDFDVDRARSEAFDRCLSSLAKLETAYMLTAGDLRYRPTTLQTCFSACPWATVDPVTDTWDPIQLFMVNEALARALSPPKLLDDNALFQLQMRLERMSAQSPFLTFAERAFAAQRAYRIDGDYASTVLNGYTAGEVLFDTVLLTMAWEELAFRDPPTVTKDEIVSWFADRATLESRVRRQFHLRVRGWHAQRQTGPIHDWFDEVALIRHRVVHAGYRPTRHEAGRALDVLRQVEEFIKDVLINPRNRNKYPRTTLMFLGTPGLRRRNAYVGKIKRIAEDETEPNWIRSFAVFQEWFVNQLWRRQ